MLRASIAFFVLALVSIILGATGLAGLSMQIGKLLLVVFLVLAIISYVVAIITGGKPKQIP